MIDKPQTSALSLVTGGSSSAPAGPAADELHALADAYERLLPWQGIDEDLSEDPRYQNDRVLLRKAYAISEAAEAKLIELRALLAAIPAKDLVELARKAGILRLPSDWIIGDDPLQGSLCNDVLRLAGAQPLPERAQITDGMIQRVRDADFEAPPRPWEVDIDREDEE